MPEQLAALARADSSAASGLALCSDRRAELENHFKSLIDAGPGRFTDTQLTTARTMPYHLRELSEACKASLNALVTLVPQLPKIMGPIQGTVDEWVKAEMSSDRARENGTHVKLHFGEKALSGKPELSSADRKKKAESADPKD